MSTIFSSMALHFSRHPPSATQHLSIYTNLSPFICYPLVPHALFLPALAFTLPLPPHRFGLLRNPNRPCQLPLTEKSPHFFGRKLKNKELPQKSPPQRTRFREILSQPRVKTSKNDTSYSKPGNTFLYSAELRLSISNFENKTTTNFKKARTKTIHIQIKP